VRPGGASAVIDTATRSRFLPVAKPFCGN